MEEVNVGDIVTEITDVISIHLKRVITNISNHKEESQTNKILNQLPFVQKLKDENDELKKKLKLINDKYKSCLEELITVRKQYQPKQVVMEITELANEYSNKIVTHEEIASTLNIEESNQNNLLNLWGIDSGTSDSNDLSLSEEDNDAEGG